jgi:hypothetical protein
MCYEGFIVIGGPEDKKLPAGGMRPAGHGLDHTELKLHRSLTLMTSWRSKKKLSDFREL